MKRAPLSIAILVSLVLIIGALVFRFSNSKTTQAGLTGILNQENTNTPIQNSGEDVVVTEASSGTTTPLTNTDLVSRQIFSDYIDLASNGQDTDANIDILAKKYADQIPSLIAAPTVKLSDIIVVANSKENMKAYSDSITSILTQYASQLRSSQASTKDLSVGQNTYALARIFSKAYSEAAQKLKLLKVPTALVVSHQKLLNNYLASAVATNALSEGDKDPATAFAGIVIFNKNLQEGPAILEEIQSILTSNGV